MNDIHEPPTLLHRVIRFCLENKFLVLMGLAFVCLWGVIVAPFDWELKGLPRAPVHVDAIPDIGENQQIVFTEWMGRSPQDVEDQVTYPLTVALLGIPKVKTIRAYSMFGFSTVFIIFEENAEFYWTRSRVLEKLNSLPEGTLPAGVSPALGPDATGLGQVFWYTLEGRDPEGNPTGGWDLHELRSIQDWHVRFALQAAEGVSEVASIGGFVREYQVDVDPDAMRAFGVTLEDVYAAVRASNLDVGARGIEINRVEYLIRGVGFIKRLEDLERAVVKVADNVPVYLKNVARVAWGPAFRQGALDKEGAEAVGGVVVVRYGENPLQAIKNVKRKIADIAPGLPKKTLADGTVSQVTIVPFYDRTGLIHETLDTLNNNIMQQVLITVLVILIMVNHLQSSVLISAVLPISVLMTFITMKLFGIDANIVSLSGIAIAIGTLADLGIVMCENIMRRLEEASPDESPLEVVYRAAAEVSGAVYTAVATTIIGFLPVFAMQAAEGKLFRPLAFTKTFALAASLVVAMAVLPAFAQLLFTARIRSMATRIVVSLAIVALGVWAGGVFAWWVGAIVVALGVYRLSLPWLPPAVARRAPRLWNSLAIVVVAWALVWDWLPLGAGHGFARNAVFVFVLVGGFLGFYMTIQYFYGPILRWCLRHKILFLSVPCAIVILGLTVWLGFERLFGWLPYAVRSWRPVTTLAHAFPGLGKEFMPALDEGSFLYMPTVMPHASIGEALDVMQKQDLGIRGVPEVDVVVGKLGRVESPLDPAPTSMFETVVHYKSEYLLDERGRRRLFRYDPRAVDLMRSPDGEPLLAPDGQPYTVRGQFVRDERGALIPDENGFPFRLWRKPLDPALNEGRAAWKGIRRSDDIWDQIVKQAQVPGSTAAPKLQPIAARLVMLQSGMRAPMGVKIKGPDLETISQVGLELERLLKEVPAVEPAAVIADRIVGKPYLEIRIDRDAIARFGLNVADVQEVIEVAIGGKPITTTVEGRERYAVRVRYPRELRDNIEALGRILVPTPDGAQVPLAQLAEIVYVRGPEMIKSEDTFLVGYVLFDKRPGFAEVDAVEQAQRFLRHKMETGEFVLPAGVSFTFAGNYENQLRAAERLRVVLPLALFIIYMLLYLEFKQTPISLFVFLGIIVSWAGGFIMIWCYNQPWFLNFSVWGENIRDLFQIHPVNLSVAVWVGFLALFGIAEDDGVVMATYLEQSFHRHAPDSVEGIREAVVQGGLRRVRACMMTTVTTVVALLPVMTSTGRGSDIMAPMAIPIYGGMLVEVFGMFVVPVLYCWRKERRLKRGLA